MESIAKNNKKKVRDRAPGLTTDALSLAFQKGLWVEVVNTTHSINVDDVIRREINYFVNSCYLSHCARYYSSKMCPKCRQSCQKHSGHYADYSISLC